MSNLSIPETFIDSVNSSSSTTLHCRVQYLDDTDPFSSVNLPEPARPPSFTFLTATILSNQINSVHKLLNAPHQVILFYYKMELINKIFFYKLPDCTLELYRQDGTKGEFGPYLDLDQTLDEQREELESFTEGLVDFYDLLVSYIYILFFL